MRTLKDLKVDQITYTRIATKDGDSNEMPRVRYRLDYLEPTNQDKNELLSSTKLAEIVCHLLLWDKGLLYATSLCSHDYLRVDRKALLGRPNDI